MYDPARYSWWGPMIGRRSVFLGGAVVSKPKLKPTTDSRCGTTAGYAAHRKRGETACTACKRANAQRTYQRRQKLQAERESELSRLPGAGRVETPGDARLGRRGRTLFGETARRWELAPAAREVLLELARLLDRAERLNGALSSRRNLWFELGEPSDEVDGLPEFTVNVSPILGEARSTAAQIGRLARQLGIDTVTPVEVEAPVSGLDEIRQRRQKRLEQQREQESS